MSTTIARRTVPWWLLTVVVLLWLFLGLAAAVAAAAAVVWVALGAPSRARVLALAGLGLVAVAIGWVAAGVPDATELGTFTNTGGRDWLDWLARASLGLFGIGAVLPPGDTVDPPSRSISDGPARLTEVDRLRAVAIVTVVFIHGLPFRPPVTDYLDYWLSDVTRFSVATLVFLSGWLVGRQRVGSAWVRRRLARLLPAYLAASIVMMVLARITPAIDARPVLQTLLLGDAVGPYYYVFVLVILTMVTPVLVRIPARAAWGLFVAAAAASLAIEVADLSLYLHNHLPLTWLPYYLGGQLLREHRLRLVHLRERWEAIALAVVAVLVLAIQLAPIETTPRRVLTWLLIWATLTALLVTALRLRRPTSGLVRTLSQRSYLVYLYHPPIMAGLAGTFGSPFLTGRPVTATVTTVALLLVMAQLAQLALPRHATRWFGA